MLERMDSGHDLRTLGMAIVLQGHQWLKGFRSQAATIFEQGAVEGPDSLRIAGEVFAFLHFRPQFWLFPFMIRDFQRLARHRTLDIRRRCNSEERNLDLESWSQFTIL